MVLVALDLGRPSFMALNDQPGCISIWRHRRRKVDCFSRNEFFRLANVRRDVFFGLACTRGETGQGKRCAHKLQKSPAADGVGKLACVLGELTMKQLLELFGVSKLFKTAPILLTGRSWIEKGRGLRIEDEGLRIEDGGLRNENRGLRIAIFLDSRDRTHQLNQLSHLPCPLFPIPYSLSPIPYLWHVLQLVITPVL